jgi:2,3-bisphosphoglycerate-independent phosphoglycerate mutase
VTTHTARPVVLLILDGWGLAADGPGNAVALAQTPHFDHWWATAPTTTLSASGMDVGLPRGQMGNSEVGHLNIGAGFVVYQELTRITAAVESGEFFENAVLQAAFAHAEQRGSNLHLMGLFGPGGVHAHDEHLYALLETARRRGFSRVYLHLFLDGRDVLPRSALGFMDGLEAAVARSGVGRIATISGRYFAMDRDLRWERTGLAYAALTAGSGPTAADARSAIAAAYAAGVSDEFVLPTVIVEDGRPIATVAAGDAVIFTNFRPDRGRQLTRALVNPDVDAQIRAHYTAQEAAGQPLPATIWQRGPALADLHVVTMTQYEPNPRVQTAFTPRPVTEPLAAVASAAGKRQFHIAETEKYPHVTFFLNGGHEAAYDGEDRVLVPSPKVATYDLQPEMSAAGVTTELLKAVESGQYDLIVCNYANPDMVGHTGSIPAVIKAVEAVDAGIGQVIPAVLARGGALLAIADHGNAEQMIDPETGGPHTAHTTNPVPCVLIGGPQLSRQVVRLRDGGRLADVAPTILALMGLKPSDDMQGHTLIEPIGA